MILGEDENLIEGVQLHLQPRQGQDLGRVAAVDSQLAQVGLQSFPSSGSLYVSHRYNPPHHFHQSPRRDLTLSIILVILFVVRTFPFKQTLRHPVACQQPYLLPHRVCQVK